MTIHTASLINPADDYSFITDRIAIGSVASRVTPGFVAIVSILSGDPYDEKYGAPKPPSHYTDHQGVQRRVAIFNIDQRDGEPGLGKHLSVATNFIAAFLGRGCVLVHCGAGMSRSVSVVSAYLCRYAGMRLDEAIGFIKERRQGACPADIFIAEITRWLRLDILSHTGPRR